MITQTFTLAFVSRQDLVTKELAIFRFQPNKKIHFLGGQFLSLHINNHKRHYSIAHDPQDPFIEIACSYLPGGIASEKLFNLSYGEELIASAPYGKFIFHDLSVKRYILFATGTGISPYHSMLSKLTDKLKQGTNITLIFGCKTKDHLLYFDDFNEVAKKFSNFTYLISCSRENTPSSFQYGHIQQFLPNLKLNSNDAVYICGNPNMVEEVYQFSLQAAVPKEQIFREKYVVAGHKL